MRVININEVNIPLIHLKCIHEISILLISCYSLGYKVSLKFNDA